MHPARVYLTYFDANYAARGLVMLRSLLRHDPEARVFVLGFDDLTRRIVQAVLGDRVTLVTLEALHRFEPRLPALRTERTLWAYYATHKPALVWYVMNECGPVAALTFIDADVMFFSDPAPMFDEVTSASIGLSPHRFYAGTAHLEIFGPFNAGCIYWRNDAVGRRSVEEWREECLAWCAERPEADGRFMNQGYLASWPARYQGVTILSHPGVNLAPWNLDRHRIEREAQHLVIDGAPLIFYHFSGLDRTPDGRWSTHYGIERNLPLARDAIYEPYLEALEDTRRHLLRAFGVSGLGSVRPQRWLRRWLLRYTGTQLHRYEREG